MFNIVNIVILCMWKFCRDATLLGRNKGFVTSVSHEGTAFIGGRWDGPQVTTVIEMDAVKVLTQSSTQDGSDNKTQTKPLLSTDQQDNLYKSFPLWEAKVNYHFDYLHSGKKHLDKVDTYNRFIYFKGSINVFNFVLSIFGIIMLLKVFQDLWSYMSSSQCR